MTYLVVREDADTGVLPESWLTMSAEALRREAALHYGACDEGDLDPGALDWRLVIDVPLARVMPLMGDTADWSSWFEVELAMFDLEHPHVADGYRALLDEPLESPVVITLERHRVQIWDGWHRIATRIIGGAATIPAIVGRVPEGPPLADLVSRREMLPAA